MRRRETISSEASGNFYELLASRLPVDPTAPAFLLGGGSEISYAALSDTAARMASVLISEGIAPGDRIAVQAEKTPEVVMLYLATLMAGAIYVPLNTGYTAAEIEYFLGDAEPALFITDAVAWAAKAAAHAPLREAVARKPCDPAALIYTSGTTGRSKGAMLSHAALAHNALALHAIWAFTPGDVLLHALPIFHIHGLFVALHCALLSGAPMIWLPKYDDAQVLEGLSRATVLMGVPTFYTRLLARPDFTRERAAGVRLFISGSAPLLPTTFAEFSQRIGRDILERYGMSEAGIITSNPLEEDRVAGSVGYALPGVELRIAGGEPGGIETRSSSLFSGYWRNPQKTQEEFTADGFFITGDVGRQDANGRVWISGRAKDLIISGGYNVYPKEIELVLDDAEGVAESSVIGVPHPDFGEAVVAIVIADGKIDEIALMAHARSQLAVFKAPKKIIVVADLPRNAMGKVQKNVLRERYAGAFG